MHRDRAMRCNAQRNQPDTVERGVQNMLEQSSSLVRCEKQYLVQRAEQRGWLLEEVAECIASEDDAGVIVVDVNHPAYPASQRPKSPEAFGRPGTILKHWLAALMFKVTPNCRCNDRARIMDDRGCDWCEDNLMRIVDWLREEAEKRGIPFVQSIAAILVKRAISAARKEARDATQVRVQD